MRKYFVILLLGMFCGANVRAGNDQSKPPAPAKAFAVAVQRALTNALENNEAGHLDFLDTIEDRKIKKKILNRRLHLKRILVGDTVSASSSCSQSDEHAEIKKRPISPLHYAASHGMDEIADRLLRNGASVNAMNDGKIALLVAAQWGHYSMVQKLLEFNANPNKAKQCVLSAVIRARVDCRTHHRERCPECIKECVQSLLNAHADPTLVDYHGQTALHYAAREENLESVVRLLLGTEFASEAAKSSFINRRNSNYGRTALQIAAGRGNHSIVYFLIAQGADR